MSAPEQQDYTGIRGTIRLAMEHRDRWVSPSTATELLDAYRDEILAEQQAAPEQPDLHQRIAEGLDATFTSVDDFDAEVAAATVLATLQPELAELAALREQLAARPVCACYPHPADHEDHCPAARPTT